MIKRIAMKLAGKRSDEFINYCNLVCELFEYKEKPIKEIRELVNFYSIHMLYQYFLSDKNLKEIQYDKEFCGSAHKDYINIFINDNNNINVYYNDKKYRVVVSTFSIEPLIDECDSGNQCMDKKNCVCGKIIGYKYKIKIPKAILWLNKNLDDDTYTRNEILFLLFTMINENGYTNEIHKIYNRNHNKNILTNQLYIKEKMFVNANKKNTNKNKNLSEYNDYKKLFYCNYCDKMALYAVTKKQSVCYKHVYKYYKESLNIFPNCIGQMITDYLFY